MNVLFAAVAIILPAVFFFFFPVMIFDLLSWTRESARNSDDSSLPQSVLSTELQNRMKSFLMRTSADEKQIGNECVVASHPSATQSHGSIHHFTLKTGPARPWHVKIAEDISAVDIDLFFLYSIGTVIMGELKMKVELFS